jgi:hypothetical protein
VGNQSLCINPKISDARAVVCLDLKRFELAVVFISTLWISWPSLPNDSIFRHFTLFTTTIKILERYLFLIPSYAWVSGSSLITGSMGLDCFLVPEKVLKTELSFVATMNKNANMQTMITTKPDTIKAFPIPIALVRKITEAAKEAWIKGGKYAIPIEVKATNNNRYSLTD